MSKSGEMRASLTTPIIVNHFGVPFGAFSIVIRRPTATESAEPNRKRTVVADATITGACDAYSAGVGRRPARTFTPRVAKKSSETSRQFIAAGNRTPSRWNGVAYCGLLAITAASTPGIERANSRNE